MKSAEGTGRRAGAERGASAAAKAPKVEPRLAGLARQLLRIVKLLHLSPGATNVDEALMMMHEAGLTHRPGAPGLHPSGPGW